MKNIPIQGSNLESVEYDQETKTLEIKYLSGGVYKYYNVPKNIYSSLLKAISIGGHFLQNI